MDEKSKLLDDLWLQVAERGDRELQEILETADQHFQTTTPKTL
jgi:hypothetical protein